LNNITSVGNIIVKDTSTTSGNGGISSNARTQLVSNTGTITLQSTNQNTGEGTLALNGNVIAGNVNLTTGSGANDNLILVGNVGTGTGIVNLVASGDIYQVNAGTYVLAKTLNFAGSDISGSLGASLVTNATTVTQIMPSTGGIGVLISDISTTPVTVSALSATGTTGAPMTTPSISFVTGGSLTTLGAIVAGTAGNPGDVTLTSGYGMTLGGNVGIAGASNNTTLNLGASSGNVGGLLATSSVTVIGANIKINDQSLAGNIGTAAASINTAATNTLIITSPGSVNIANNSGADNVTLTVNGSQSVNFTNTATTGGGLTVGTVNALSNGGGAITIVSNNGPLTVGAAGTYYYVTSNGALTLQANGAGAAGNLTITDGANLTSNYGSVTVSTSGSSLQIGATGGADGVSLSSASGVQLTNSGSAGSVTLGDSVSVEATASGNVTISSTNAITIGDGVDIQANHGGITMNTGSGAITIGNLATGAAGAVANLGASGNISLTALGTNGAITIGNNDISAGGSSNPAATPGQLMLNSSGAINIGTVGTSMTPAELTTIDADGISIIGSSVTIGPAGYGNGNGIYGYSQVRLLSNGNINLEATGTNGSVNFYAANDSGNSFGTMEANAPGAGVSGNITLQTTGSGSSINVGAGTALSTSASFGQNSGNITLTSAGTISVGANTRLTQDGFVGSISLNASGNLALGSSDQLQAAQNVNLTTTSNSLTVGSSASITAYVGNITVQNSSTSGTIEIGNGASLSAYAPSAGLGIGNVNFQIGPTAVIADVPVAGLISSSPYQGVTVNISSNGSVNTNTFVAGTAPGFTVNPANSSVQLEGAGTAITFSNAGSSQTQIQFDGNNSILADPPAAAALPASVTLPQTVIAPAVNSLTTFTTPSTTLATVSLPFTPALNTPSTGHDNAAQQIENTGAVSIQQTGLTSLISSITSSGIAVNTSLASSSVGSPRNAGLKIENLVAPSSVGLSLPNSGLFSVTQNSANALSSLASISTGSRLANVQTSGTLQTTGAFGIQRQSQSSISSDQNKVLNGGVSLKGKSGRGGNHSMVTTELPEGVLLLAPERLTVVSTPFGSVQIADKTLALLVSNEKGLSVYNLDDSRRDSVVVHVNGENVCILPGRHMTITNDKFDSFEQVNPAPFVGYRNVRSRSLNGNLKAFHTEFNHMTAIAGLEPLRNMIKSSDPAKRKVAEHMLKTSALLSIMNKSNAPFQLMAPPSMTAMAK
jgi:hypothetical protein